MSESFKSSAILERGERHSRLRTCHLPRDTWFYPYHTTRDGGRFPAPVLAVPEEGAKIVITRNPDHERHIGRDSEEWYKIREIKTPKVISGLYGDEGLWVCLDLERGKQGGHWRGSPNY